MTKLISTKKKPQAKPPTKPVTRYECGHCTATHRTKKEADAHCICKCGRLVGAERRMGYGVSQDCEKCRTKSNLLSARARLRQVQSDLVHAKQNVERLEAEYELLKGET